MARRTPLFTDCSLATWFAPLLALSLLATPATAEQTAAAAGDDHFNETISFPWLGEQLYYSVRINDAEAMRGGLRIGDLQNSGDRHYVPIHGSARSRGFLDATYPIDDRANTYLNPTTNFPWRSEKTFDENGQFRSYDVDYDHDAFTAFVERKRKDREATFESPIPPDTHDMITWVYELRQVDELEMGDQFSFYIYDGWLLSRLDLEVAEREDLLTPMGWFKTWRFDFSREIKEETEEPDADNGAAPAFSIAEEARHTGSLWLSRDENKIPVQVTIDTPFGAGNAVLIHYEPGEPG